MNDIEVETVSSETIKPSTPTPPHLRICPVSFFDQVSPLVYIPIIFFFPTKAAKPKSLLPQLKESFTRTLTKFYPLAGRIRKDLTAVDCNDDGALYMEAEAVGCSFSKFLESPNLNLLTQFLPFPAKITKQVDEITQIGIKITTFGQEGLVIGGCFLHKFMDAQSVSFFLASWAADVRDDLINIPDPDFTTAPSKFPSALEGYDPQQLPLNPTNAAARFVFNQTAIEALKSRVKTPRLPNPTRVEALSSFLGIRLAVARRKSNCNVNSKTSVFNYAVNIRRRLAPPLAQGVMGNLVLAEFIPCEGEDGEAFGVGELGEMIREGISTVDADYVSKAHGEEGIERSLEHLSEYYFNEEVSLIWQSSWCKLGVEELDFGWGKPCLVAPNLDGRLDFSVTLLTLIDSSNGDGGIEAWLYDDERLVRALEEDQEFLQFASLNPAVSV